MYIYLFTAALYNDPINALKSEKIIVKILNI